MPKNVLVAPGLRVHICPKVATASISDAMLGVKYHHATPDEEGPELRVMPVRHPLDRIVSAWAYFCDAETDHEIKGQKSLHAIGYRYKMPFDDFLNIVLERHAENNHTQMQVDFAGPHEPHLVTLANLGKAWSMLRVAFPYLRPIKHVHGSGHAGWQDYYNHTQRDRAMQVFAPDVRLFEKAVSP